MTAEVYSGIRHADGKTSVRIGERALDPRLDLRTSPATAFDWGYEGAGAPTQLALAILADHYADDTRARRHYRDFMQRVVRRLPPAAWTLTGAEIDTALQLRYLPRT